MNPRRLELRFLAPLGVLACAVLGGALISARQLPAAKDSGSKRYDTAIQPLVKKYCLSCHSTKAKKGSLDLERFASLEQVRKDLKPWQQTIEMLETGEMPPKDKPQPSEAERKQIIDWIRVLLDAEARARAGDPGHVPLRRLSNAEYEATLRDLTNVDLKPAREFPADGAGGEGFTNAAESLSDISPTLLNKYLLAAKSIAEHAVLLPDGFRFSPAKTRRDWTDESVARLRQFYAAHASGDGRLELPPYLTATVRHRDALNANKLTIDDVARKEKLNAKYLGVLWRTLNDTSPSFPLDAIRARWRTASEKEVPGLAALIGEWQAALWKVVKVGSYVHAVGRDYRESPARQLPTDPTATDTQPVRFAHKPGPGQSEVVLYLTARDLTPGGKGGRVVWQRPRFERAGKPPLLLSDYAKYGPAYEIDFVSAFAPTPKYLTAALESVEPGQSAEDVAKKHGLDAEFLTRWIEVLNLESLKQGAVNQQIGKLEPLVALERLDEKIEKLNAWPEINGWRRKGTDLPSLVTNSSDTTRQIPGTVQPHRVVVHPTPREFVAVTWKSPIAGRIRVAARVTHAHHACGNGVAWWLEYRRGNRAYVVNEGEIDRGGKASAPVKTLTVRKDDVVMLAIDAKKGDHSCDLTDITLTITEAGNTSRTWNLAADVADNVLDGNPHADAHGSKEVWNFVRGPSRAVGKAAVPILPPGSILARWRTAAADADRVEEAAKLAEEARVLFTGKRPGKEKDPNSVLYDNLVSVASPLLGGLDLSRLGKPRSQYGLAKERFADGGSLLVDAGSAVEVRLPAALFREREFVAEGKLDRPADERAVQFHVRTAPDAAARWDGKNPVVASPAGAGFTQLLAGCAEFRNCFPLFICFPNVVPTDEVVTLKMFHREDEPLARLFLDEEQKNRIDRLWEEHRFISQQPLAEHKYLPQFIGFVTQDQPKEMVTFFEGKRPAFKKRADDFVKDSEAAISKQLDALLDFAARAYRRPLDEKQQSDLLGLYKALLKKGVEHEEAFRAVLARILVAPAFLFRVEKAPPGDKPGPVDDWELASRLSYFLTSSSPDDELRKLAAEGKLRDPKVLTAQAERLLKSDRTRALAIEFGTQWIHVRGFDELKEKNEKLFPTFDANLRAAIYEESILFFQDLFQADRPVAQLLDADATFLNDMLAKHYGIPGITGPHWRRVVGVRKHGRGGILGLASVQAKQAGASRTSPVLRGNWVVETLLGEKLPRPPANVPQLPEEEGKDKLTMRQLVEKHVSTPSCAVCHVRIDPYGFALEHYDPIGRRRDKEVTGQAIDAKAKLKDGSEFEGIDGLRAHLLSKKKDVIVRLFCRKLLGYALGRSVSLSDQGLLDEMVAAVSKKHAGVSAAVCAIVKSQQFRMIRGSDFPGE